MSRLATLSQGGKTLTYSRLANSDRLDKAEFSPASAAPAVEYSYDTKLRLISKGCGTRSFTDKDEVWYFDCPAGTPGNWGTSRYYSYDSMGQLTLAGEGALGPDGQVDNPQNFSYDSIGNHLTNNETYSILNQGSGKTYDANGNMTANGSDWRAWYDGENRMRQVVKQYDGTELLYDYAGRIYQVNSFYADEDVQETPTLNYRRIYDGTKLIATVRNGAIEDTFVWQPETSGDADVILWDNSYVYATDPNKNVRVKRFPDEWMGSGWIEEFFDYKPFGELKNYVQSPPRFMFSSEEYMPETGMYHYLYRAYSPSLARFITRDPIEEQGGVNLYCFVGNNPVSRWDMLGLECYCGMDITEKLNNILIKVKNIFNNNKNLQQSICSGIYNPEYIVDSWDIEELYKAGISNFHYTELSDNVNCPQGEKCKSTVMVSGKCYKTWAVNYILWGYLNKLCKNTYKKASDAVTAYRQISLDKTENETREFGTRSRLFWTALGYLERVDPAQTDILNEYSTLSGRGAAGTINANQDTAYTDCKKCGTKYTGYLTVRIRLNDNTLLIINGDNAGYQLKNKDKVEVR